MSQLQSLEGLIALAFIGVHCHYCISSRLWLSSVPTLLSNPSRMLFRNGWIQLALAVVTLCLVRAADLYGTLGCK